MVSDMTSDILKSLKPKKKSVNTLKHSDVLKHFSYNKRTGVLKAKRTFSTRKRYDVIDARVISFKGTSTTKNKFIWFYVTGEYIHDEIYLKNKSKGYRFDNLTLDYNESHICNISNFKKKYPYYKTNRCVILPSQERLKELFDYDGVNLIRRVTRGKGKIGSVAGYVNNENRLIVGVDNNTYDVEILLKIYLYNDKTSYGVFHNRKDKFKYEEVGDFDYVSTGKYQSWKNGDIVEYV